eukprot:jgi/Mesvir1/6980/Mv09121-RA.2
MEGSGNENPAPVMAAPVQPVNLSPGHVRERPGMGPHAGMVSPGPMLERPAMAPNGMGVYAMTPMGGMGGMDDMRQLEHFMAGLSFDPAAHLNPNAREFLPPFEYPNGGPMDPMQRMPPMPRSIMMHPPMHGGMPIIYAAGPHPGAMGGPVGPRPPNMPMGIGMMPPGPQGGPMVPHMPPHRQHHQMMLPPQMQRPGGLDMKRDKKGRKMGYANQGHTNGGNQGGRRRNQNNNQSNNQNNNQNANNNSKENKDNSNNNNQGNQNQNSSNSANSNGNPSAGASAGGGSQNGQGYVQGQGGPAAGGGSNGNNSAAGMGGHPGGGKNTRAMREDSIKRTVYVSDIDQQVSEEQLAALFNQCGEVVDCRVCGDPNSVLRFAFVEFSNEVGRREGAVRAHGVRGQHRQEGHAARCEVIL